MRIINVWADHFLAQELGNIWLLYQVVGLGEYQYACSRNSSVWNVTDT